MGELGEKPEKLTKILGSTKDWKWNLMLKARGSAAKEEGAGSFRQRGRMGDLVLKQGQRRRLSTEPTDMAETPV